MADLLTAPYSFVNLNLSRFYGVRQRGGWDRVHPGACARRPQRDPGVLGHASVLATHATGVDSSPVKRGKLVRTRLLCQTLPDPPQDVDTMLKPPGPSQTTRQRNKEHTDNPACSGCHSVIDPIGFGFERYDGFGRRRETENGTAVDSTGVLTATSAGDVPLRRRGRAGSGAGPEPTRPRPASCATGRTSRTGSPPGPRTPAPSRTWSPRRPRASFR